MNGRRRWLAGAFGAALTAGCAGFRGGWASLPYVGDAPPAPADAMSPYDLRAHALALPGLRLQVSIDNRLRSYDTQVWFFALPVSVDPRNVHTDNHRPGTTRVFVSATPEVPDYVFRPSLATLSFGGRRFEAVAGHRFGLWDAQGRLVDRDGRWEHRRIDRELVLTPTSRAYLLSVDFETPVPSPESRDIVLDLSRALAAPARSPLPPVRFVPVRWKEGYT